MYMSVCAMHLVSSTGLIRGTMWVPHLYFPAVDWAQGRVCSYPSTECVCPVSNSQLMCMCLQNILMLL